MKMLVGPSVSTVTPVCGHMGNASQGDCGRTGGLSECGCTYLIAHRDQFFAILVELIMRRREFQCPEDLVQSGPQGGGSGGGLGAERRTVT